MVNEEKHMFWWNIWSEVFLMVLVFRALSPHGSSSIHHVVWWISKETSNQRRSVLDRTCISSTVSSNRKKNPKNGEWRRTFWWISKETIDQRHLVVCLEKALKFLLWKRSDQRRCFSSATNLYFAPCSVFFDPEYWVPGLLKSLWKFATGAWKRSIQVRHVRFAHRHH